MNSLPEELYDLIARSVDDADLPALALVAKAWYNPARRCTMWTVWGSDSASRFSKLLNANAHLPPLVRALVVDRVPHARHSDLGASAGTGAGADPAADMMDAIAFDMERMTDAGFTLATFNDELVQLGGGPAKAESMQLFELALELIGQCALLQRFFLLALPGYWTNMMGTADPREVEAQQLRLVAAVGTLEQLVVCGLWDEANLSPVQLGFNAFRALLATGPAKLRNISWPIEGPLEEGDLVWGPDTGSDDDAPQPLDATDRRLAARPDDDLSTLPQRHITDVQLTLFHLSLAHYDRIAAAVFPGVKRLVIDISAGPTCIPKPDVMRALFDDANFGDGLEWFSADVACLPASSNPLTLGVRPRFPTLSLNHEGGVYTVCGQGPLGDSDQERFNALKENSVIYKGIVWKRRELETVLGPLEVLLPGVELVEV